MRIHSTAIENFRTQQRLQKVKEPHESKAKGKNDTMLPTFIYIGLMAGLYIAASLIYSF